MKKRKTLMFLCVFAILGWSCNQKQRSFQLEIISTSDLHGYALSPSEEHIGYIAITNYTEFIRDKNENVLLVDVGDYIQGNALTNFSKGANVIDVMNVAGYDAAVVGKHEFDFGWQELVNRKNEANFPLISANIRDGSGKSPFLSYKSFIFDNISVAVIGITTPETAIKTAPANMADWYFLDPIEILKPLVRRLKKGHEIVILLAQLGSEGIYSVRNVAEQVEGIDLIIDGIGPVTKARGVKTRNTFILNTGSNATGLGHTTIKVEKGVVTSVQGKFLDLSAEELNAGYKMYPRATKVSDLLKKIDNDNQKLFQQIVTYVPRPMEGEREVVRRRETELGRLIADSFRYEAQSDFAFMNGGGIRSSLEPGNVTFENLISVLPFDNVVVKIMITGEDLRKALEHGLSVYPEESGAFPHISGFTYSYDISAPAGSRIREILIDGQPINANKEYSMALVSFLSMGGDGYRMFEKPTVGEFSSDTDILVRYLKERGERAFNDVIEPRSRLSVGR